MSTYLYSIFFILFLISCQNDNTIFEDNRNIDNQAWLNTENANFDVHITDATSKYDVFINLRHTSSYDFSNIFLLLKINGEGIKDSTIRKEISLAAMDGKWFGNSSGSLYHIESLVKENFTFPDTGIYSFGIEQNMRVNPLKDIADVGIKIIKK